MGLQFWRFLELFSGVDLPVYLVAALSLAKVSAKAAKAAHGPRGHGQAFFSSLLHNLLIKLRSL
jgi:hypothetical protein